MTPSQSQQPPGGGRRATRQGFLGGAVDLGGQGQDDQDGMNPSQGFSCRGQAGKDSLVTTKKTPVGDFLVVRLDSRAETRATKRPGEDLVVRLDSWDETRATKWTLFILGGGLLGGGHGLDDQETREEDGGDGLGGHGFDDQEDGLPSHDRQQLGGGRGATQRVHLGGVDGLGG